MALLDEMACHVMADYIASEVNKSISNNILRHAEMMEDDDLIKGVHINKRRGMISIVRRAHQLVRTAEKEIGQDQIASLFKSGPDGTCIQKLEYLVNGTYYRKLTMRAERIDRDCIKIFNISRILIGLDRIHSEMANLTQAIKLFHTANANDSPGQTNDWKDYRNNYYRIVPVMCAMHATKVSYLSIWNNISNDEDLIRVGHFALIFADALKPLLPSNVDFAIIILCIQCQGAT